MAEMTNEENTKVNELHVKKLNEQKKINQVEVSNIFLIQLYFDQICKV